MDSTKKDLLKNRIFLLGYMGCGKSTLGKELAKQLKISFIDLDQFIEKQEKTTISNLFNQKGEFHFRKIEKDALDHLLKDLEPALEKSNFSLGLYGMWKIYTR